MGYLRFWRRMKIAPGVTLNVSKSGGSLSLGPRGAKHTISSRGRRTTVGIPGTGLFYTTTGSTGGRAGQASRGRKAGAPAAPAKDPGCAEAGRLTLGFFKRLVTPAGEEAFVDGCRELSQGRYGLALQHLRGATHLTDGAFLAGFLCLKQEQAAAAIPLLEQAAREYRRLGRYFDKYGLALTLSLPITEEIAAHVGPSLRGTLLALVEACQVAGDWDRAHACLQRLRKLEPEDVVILLSLVELLWQANYGNQETCRHIVKLTGNIDNTTPVHTALLLYKARALNGLKMHAAARDILTKTLRRKKGRSRDLMLALRYERALTYEAIGQPRRARTDLEKIYAANPDFEDVARRLSGRGR
ncbi:MAG: DUF4236 domain-containing protein [Lentisphaerae bacterium]|nr:DUF4236 domain-containing protein [Lentisphaerota bacterium]